MSEEKEVPAEVINNLTEQILKELDTLKRVLLFKNKDVEDEFVHRVVAVFGALLLMLEEHMQYMLKNGYTPEHIDRLERVFMDSFVLVNSASALPIKDESTLKN